MYSVTCTLVGPCSCRQGACSAKCARTPSTARSSNCIAGSCCSTGHSDSHASKSPRVWSFPHSATPRLMRAGRSSPACAARMTAARSMAATAGPKNPSRTTIPGPHGCTSAKTSWGCRDSGAPRPGSGGACAAGSTGAGAAGAATVGTGGSHAAGRVPSSARMRCAAAGGRASIEDKHCSDGRRRAHRRSSRADAPRAMRACWLKLAVDAPAPECAMLATAVGRGTQRWPLRVAAAAG